MNNDKGAYYSESIRGFFRERAVRYDLVYTVKALNSALLSSGKALISGQKLDDQLFLCSKSPQ